MTHQPSIFDAPAAARAAQRVQEQIRTNADPSWLGRARSAVRDIATRYPEFITDDVWEFTDLSHAHDNRALGPVMKQAQREGWIVPTDRTRSGRQVSNHARPQRVWRSRIHREGVA